MYGDADNLCPMDSVAWMMDKIGHMVYGNYQFGGYDHADFGKANDAVFMQELHEALSHLRPPETEALFEEEFEHALGEEIEFEREAEEREDAWRQAEWEEEAYEHEYVEEFLEDHAWAPEEFHHDDFDLRHHHQEYESYYDELYE